MDIVEFTERRRLERMRVIHEAQALLDDVSREKRHMSAEENATWERLMARADEIEKEVRDLDQREKRESEAAVAREAFERQVGSTDPKKRDEPDAAAVLRAFVDPESGAPDHMTLNVAAAVREKEAIRSGASPQELVELRSLLWDTGSSASLVPTLLSRTLYEYFEASNAVYRMPTTKLITASGAPLDVPRVGAHAVATQVAGMATVIAGTDPTFAKTQFGAFKYGQIVKLAHETIQDSGVDIVDFVFRDIGRALGRITATPLAVGSGTGEPMGVMTAIGGAGTIATGGSLVDPTVEKLIDVKFSVNDEYRSSKASAWLMRDLTAAVISKLRDGEGGTVGAFLWQPSVTQGLANGQPDRLLGHAVYTDSSIASLASNAKVIAFGDFSAFYIRQAGDFVIERDDSRWFDTDEVGLRGKVRIDSDLLDTGAINLIKRSV